MNKLSVILTSDHFPFSIKLIFRGARPRVFLGWDNLSKVTKGHFLIFIDDPLISTRFNSSRELGPSRVTKSSGESSNFLEIP
jgi:hypothetical protein